MYCTRLELPASSLGLEVEDGACHVARFEDVILNISNGVTLEVVHILELWQIIDYDLWIVERRQGTVDESVSAHLKPL